MCQLILQIDRDGHILVPVGMIRSLFIRAYKQHDLRGDLAVDEADRLHNVASGADYRVAVDVEYILYRRVLAQVFLYSVGGVVVGILIGFEVVHDFAVYRRYPRVVQKVGHHAPDRDDVLVDIGAALRTLGQLADRALGREGFGAVRVQYQHERFIRVYVA